MTTPADNVRRKPMGEVRQNGRAARLFEAPEAYAGFTSCGTDALARREPGQNDGIARQWLEKDGHLGNLGLAQNVEKGIRMRVNYLAVVVAAAVFFAIDAAWYLPFSRQWSAAVGFPASEVGSGSNAYVYAVAFVAALLVAYGLARVVVWRPNPSWKDGAMAGVLLSVMIFAPLTLMDYSFERRSLVLFFINAGCVFVGMTAGGAILGAWQAKRSR